jgi:hypothetical protein
VGGCSGGLRRKGLAGDARGGYGVALAGPLANAPNQGRPAFQGLLVLLPFVEIDAKASVDADVT